MIRATMKFVLCLTLGATSTISVVAVCDMLRSRSFYGWQYEAFREDLDGNPLQDDLQIDATAMFMSAEGAREVVAQQSRYTLAAERGPVIQVRRKRLGITVYETYTPKSLEGSCFPTQTAPAEAFGKVFDPYPESRLGHQPERALRYPGERRYEMIGFPFRCAAMNSIHPMDAPDPWHWYRKFGKRTSLSLMAYTESFSVTAFMPWWRSGGDWGFLNFEVPRRVLPIGFVANTLVYSAAWFFVPTAPMKLRRALRRRAGKCVKCKYDLTGIDTDQQCPECGRIDLHRSEAACESALSAS